MLIQAIIFGGNLQVESKSQLLKYDKTINYIIIQHEQWQTGDAFVEIIDEHILYNLNAYIHTSIKFAYNVQQSFL